MYPLELSRHGKIQLRNLFRLAPIDNSKMTWLAMKQLWFNFL